MRGQEVGAREGNWEEAIGATKRSKLQQQQPIDVVLGISEQEDDGIFARSNNEMCY